MTVAIIPARGGSKRISGKNIVDMMGRPMVGWSIRNALQSGAFSRVIVSTDCPDIAEAARQSGAEVPALRPADISDDMATVDAVMRYAIEACDITSEWVCLLYATAVLVRPETLAAADEITGGADPGTSFVMSLTPYPHPIQRAVVLEGGQVRMLMPAHAKTRTQDLEPRYHDAAQFVFGRRDAWMAGRTVWDSTTQGVVLTQSEAVDIDTPEDLEIARALLKNHLATQVTPQK